MMEFADRLKMAMKQVGITQTRLAEESGISGPTISLILSGKRNARIDTLCLICDVLKVTPNDLLGYSQKQEKKPVRKVRPIDGIALRSRIRKYLASGGAVRTDGTMTPQEVYDMIDTMPVIASDENHP